MPQTIVMLQFQQFDFKWQKTHRNRKRPFIKTELIEGPRLKPGSTLQLDPGLNTSPHPPHLSSLLWPRGCQRWRPNQML